MTHIFIKMDEIIIEDIKSMEIRERPPPWVILEGDGIDELYGDAYERGVEIKNGGGERIEKISMIILVAVIILLLIGISIGGI